jgi:hypothetical protein
LATKSATKALLQRRHRNVDNSFVNQVVKGIALSLETEVEPKQELVERLMREGGQPFVDAIQKYGRNEQGEELKMTPWFIELAYLVGDLRIGQGDMTGCSQLGKTLLMSLRAAFLLIECRLNGMWGFDQRESRDIQVPSNFRPIAEKWVELKTKETGVKIQTAADKKNNTIFQVAGAIIQFMYVSTSSTKSDGKAAAGGTAVGVSRDFGTREERSQYPPGAGDVLDRRLDASRIPTRPMWDNGTPGGGLGIEAEVKKAHHNFYPHYKCPKCNSIKPLHPYGCLFKEAELSAPGNKVKHSFLSVSGRPLKWWCHDENDAVETAYFGCSECGAELDGETRTNSTYQCLNTGLRLSDFLDALPEGVPKKRWHVAAQISPLLRVQETNRAVEIVQKGLTTENTADWQQQMLGLESQGGSGSISLESIRWAIAATKLERTPDVVLLGGDQGRGQHWIWVNAIYLPEDWKKMSIAQLMDSCLRICLFGGDIRQDELPTLISTLGVSYGLVDNEPDITYASSLSGYNIEMADQKSTQLDTTKKSEVKHGGKVYPCWFLKNNYFLGSVQNNFSATWEDGESLQRLPNDWNKWLSQISHEKSPIRHLMSVRYDSGLEKWVRPDDHIDDVYYAGMFCEAALYIWLSSKINSRSYGTSRAKW